LEENYNKSIKELESQIEKLKNDSEEKEKSLLNNKEDEINLIEDNYKKSIKELENQIENLNNKNEEGKLISINTIKELENQLETLKNDGKIMSNNEESYKKLIKELEIGKENELKLLEESNTKLKEENERLLLAIKKEEEEIIPLKSVKSIDDLYKEFENELSELNENVNKKKNMNQNKNNEKYVNELILLQKEKIDSLESIENLMKNNSYLTEKLNNLQNEFSILSKKEKELNIINTSLKEENLNNISEIVTKRLKIEKLEKEIQQLTIEFEEKFEIEKKMREMEGIDEDRKKLLFL
jgi:hypothetical protein